jgi:hypothetical protein
VTKVEKFRIRPSSSAVFRRVLQTTITSTRVGCRPHLVSPWPKPCRIKSINGLPWPVRNSTHVYDRVDPKRSQLLTCPQLRNDGRRSFLEATSWSGLLLSSQLQPPVSVLARMYASLPNDSLFKPDSRSRSMPIPHGLLSSLNGFRLHLRRATSS